MKHGNVRISDLIHPVRNWNPSTSVAADFVYVDISSVDAKQKRIAEPKNIPCSSAPSRARQLLESTDVLVSTVRPNLNCVAYVSGELEGAIASTGFCVLRPNKQALDSRYLFHWVQSEAFIGDMVSKSTGASYPAVSDSIIHASEIPLPPLEEQRRIAAILDKAENINSLLKARQAEADLLMQSVFIDLFGNPKEEPGNSLFYIATLGECCVLFSGGTLPDGEENTGQEGGFLLLKVSDMNLPGNEERIKTSKLWASSPGAKSATCPAGSVVIPKRGGAIGTNKKRVVDRDAVLDPNLMAIAPRDQTITTEFLRGWFSFLDLSSITSGSSVPQLNKQDLSPLRLAIPHLKAQERYKELAIRALSMSDRLQKQSDNSHVLLGALQRKCFGGNNYE